MANDSDSSDSEVDISYCKYCNRSFTNLAAFNNHARGMVHINLYMDAKATKAKEKGKDINTNLVEWAAKQKQPKSNKRAMVGDDESDSSDDEDKCFCKYCQRNFTSPQAYYSHARGMVHHNLKMEAKAAKKAPQQLQTTPVEVHTDSCNTAHRSSLAASALSGSSGGKRTQTNVNFTSLHELLGFNKKHIRQNTLDRLDSFIKKRRINRIDQASSELVKKEQKLSVSSNESYFQAGMDKSSKQETYDVYIDNAEEDIKFDPSVLAGISSNTFLADSVKLNLAQPSKHT